MEFWELFLLAVGLSMDAFAVSVSSAMTIDNLRKRDAAKFGLFFGVFQAGMPLLGWLCGCAFSSYVITFDHWVAFVLLSFIGGKMILEAVREEDECRENPLAFSVLLVLAIATSIDALAVGVTFAFMPGLPVLPSVALIGAVTFVISTCGALLGKKAGSALGTKAELVGGLILIGIGLKILVEHLFFA